MRSSCVAFCLFAISLSAPSFASSIDQRDGHIAYPSGQSPDAENDSDYPSEGSDQTPPATTPKTTSSPAPWSSSGVQPSKNSSVQPKTQPASADKQPPSDYPAEGSGPDTVKDATSGNGSPAPAPIGDQKPNTSAPWSAAPVENQSQNTSAPWPASSANSSYPSSDNSTYPSSDSYPPGGNLTSTSNSSALGPSGPGENQTSPNLPTSSSTMQCSSYLDANTSHASCGPEGTPYICTGGCTGAIVAQLCQLNETSPVTTQTCTNAYRESSATVHVCINDAGAFSCKGPTTGSVCCSGCPPGLGSNTPGSTPSEGSGSANGSTSETPGGDNENSASAFPSSFNAFLASAFTLLGGFLFL